MKKCLLLSVGDTRTKTCLAGIFKRGIEKFKYQVVQHHPQLFNPYDTHNYQIAITNGLRGNLEVCRDNLREEGKKTIVFDLGYIDRSATGVPNGYYQIGLDRLGWVPNFSCPPDRFNNLGVEITPTRVKDSNKVLVIGQKFNDPQHKMNEDQHKAYCKKTCKTFKELGYEVDFRPHPKSKFSIEGFDTCNGGNFSELIKDYKMVVVYNSTAGVEALLAGVPVIAMAEDAHYREVCSRLWEDGKMTTPDIYDVEDYMYRLAYSQWKREEIEEGVPFKFLLSVMDDIDPFSLDYDYTAHQPKKAAEDPFKGISNMKWYEQRRLVKKVCGETPKNKVHRDILIENWYNCA